MGYPTIKLSKYGNWIVHHDPENVERLIQFVNAECGTERMRGGLLHDTAGTIKQADVLAKDFLDGKEGCIEKAKNITGAEFYVKMMERAVAKGLEQLQQDFDGMSMILDQRKGSIATLDGVKTRYNVISKFLTKKELPVEEVDDSELTPDDEDDLAALDELLQEDEEPDL
jgi:alpha-mannosidase